jgi:hypothetical protein
VEELSRRQRLGIPLIKPELLPAREAPRPYAGPPRNADEVERAERGHMRGAAVDRHRANQRTKRYKRLRERRLKLAGHRCETCKRGGPLQLHHLHYDTLGRESVDDVRMLCDDCHGTVTWKQKAIKKARWRQWGGRVRLMG